jgi:hypothetical protein
MAIKKNSPGHLGQNSASLVESGHPSSGTVNTPQQLFTPNALINIRGYEPLFRHRSLVEERLRERSCVETIDTLERTKIDFYVSYFRKKPQRLLDVGIHALDIVDPAKTIREYLTVGFEDLLPYHRNNLRDISVAKRTLTQATSAWRQHLKRSGLTKEKQLVVFIPETLYTQIKEARSTRKKSLPPGQRFSLNRIIVTALEREFKRQMHLPSEQKERNPSE